MVRDERTTGGRRNAYRPGGPTTAVIAGFRDRGVYLPALDTLVVADLHVGRGEASDVKFPIEGDLSGRLVALLDHHQPARVVFAGDVLHQFSRVSTDVRETFDALTAACRAAGARPAMVAGNHDSQLDRCWDGPIHEALELDASGERGTRPAEQVVPDGPHAPALGEPIVVRHGHESPPADEARETGTYLIGHDHPTLEIEGKRRPCYLFTPDGPGGASVVMLPAFNRLPAGVDVAGMSGSDFQSPFVTTPNDCRPLVWDADAERTLSFPPLGEFRRLL